MTKLFSFLCAFSVLHASEETPFKITPTFEWIKPCDFSLEQTPVKPSQIDTQTLLIDLQRNVEEKITYHHLVSKILNKNGANQFTQIRFDFDPHDSQLVFHTLRIFRNGRWIDRLHTSRHNLIQRETDLNYNIYNGKLTLVYFLEDLREGDVLEYAYSYIGRNPFLLSPFTEWVTFQRYPSIEKISYRLLAPPDLSFTIKNVRAGIEPTIQDLSPNLKEWIWVKLYTPECSWETNIPPWYIPLAYIEMSQYQSWEEVGNKIAPLFEIDPAFYSNTPIEMQELVKDWMQESDDPLKQALFAVRFVQDNIRYLGFEEGFAAQKPTPPELTWQRRFGDCKDKTQLLRALLQLMDISSTPVLVHSSAGKVLPDQLPALYAFNHAVIQIELDGKSYYIDPTIDLQGGTIEENYFPDYSWGLLLKSNSSSLIPLPKIASLHPAEINSFYTFKSPDTVILNTQAIFHHLEADSFRRRLAIYGIQELSDSTLSEIQTFYGNGSIVDPYQVEDDRQNNRLVVKKSFEIQLKQPLDTNPLKLFSLTIRKCLSSDVNPERSAPYAIEHPLWVKERICVHNPYINWSPSKKNYVQKHPSLECSLINQIEKNDFEMVLELKHLQDHVATDQIRDFWKIVNEFRNEVPFFLTIKFSSLTDPLAFIPNTTALSVLALVLWPLFYFINRYRDENNTPLVFALKNFGLMHFPTIIPTILCTTTNPTLFPFLLVVSFLFYLASARAAMKNPKQTILIWKYLLFAQFVYLAYWVYLTPNIQLYEMLLCSIAIVLYLGSSLKYLHKMRSIVYGNVLSESIE